MYYTFLKIYLSRINPQFRIVVTFGEEGNELRVGYTGTIMASVIFYFLRMFVILLHVYVYITEIVHK